MASSLRTALIIFISLTRSNCREENEPKEETIRILNNYKNDIEIESTSSKENTVKLIDTKKEGFDYELTVEVTPPPKKDDVIKFTDIFYINLTNGDQLALNCTGFYDY